MTALASLPHPVWFKFPIDAAWGALLREPITEDLIDANHWRFRECNDCWVMLTYLHLRARGLDVRITDHFVPGAICVASYWDLPIKALPLRSYVVACRHDGPRPEICEHTIVQNPSQVTRGTDHLIQHWPQPGLIPRDRSRGPSLRRVDYKGWENNLWEALRAPAFREALARMDVELHIDGKPQDARQLRWHDYAHADAVLAVRDLTERDYYNKPASKLINAWLAGVPALLGPEPAYQALRRSELDYFEVRTPADAIDAIARLRADPGLYARVVENGNLRSREFTTHQIAARWRDVLAGPVAEGFASWRERPVAHRVFVRPARFLARSLLHKVRLREYLRHRDHGYRPISGART